MGEDVLDTARKHGDRTLLDTLQHNKESFLGSALANAFSALGDLDDKRKKNDKKDKKGEKKGEKKGKIRRKGKKDKKSKKNKAPFLLESGFRSEQGRRKTQEDAEFLADALVDVPGFPTLEIDIPEPLALYAVYDGHGGDQASGYAADIFHQALFQV